MTDTYTQHYRAEALARRTQEVEKWRAQRERQWSVWSKTKGRCWYCGIQCQLRTGSVWHQFCVGHLLLLSLGGSDTLENLIPSCRPCIERRRYDPLETFRSREAARTFPFHGTVRFWGEQQNDASGTTSYPPSF